MLRFDVEHSGTFAVLADDEIHSDVLAVGPLIDEVSHDLRKAFVEEAEVVAVQEGGVRQDEAVVADPEGQPVVAIAAVLSLDVCPGKEANQSVRMVLQIKYTQ